jgi:hypothetical protein
MAHVPLRIDWNATMNGSRKNSKDTKSCGEDPGIASGRRQLGWESSGFDQFFAALGDSRGYKRLAEIFFYGTF